MDPEFRSFIGDNALSIDLINIAPLDDLHQPMGVIEEAQKLAAADREFPDSRLSCVAVLVENLAKPFQCQH